MELRVVTYNIQRCLHWQALSAFFSTSAAMQSTDIIAIQEALITESRDFCKEIASALGGGHRHAYGTVMRYPGKEYGNLILFKAPFELIRQSVVELPRLDKLRWFERLKTEGGVPDSKSALVVHLACPAYSLIVAAVHLDFAGGPSHRARQLFHVIQWLDRYVKARRISPPLSGVVVCGDFNTTGYYRLRSAGQGTAHALHPATSEGFIDCTDSIAWTSDLCSSIDPADPAATMLRAGRSVALHWRQKTDHILTRGDLRLEWAGLVTAEGGPKHGMSDHLPICAVLASQEEGKGAAV